MAQDETLMPATADALSRLVARALLGTPAQRNALKDQLRPIVAELVAEQLLEEVRHQRAGILREIDLALAEGLIRPPDTPHRS